MWTNSEEDILYEYFPYLSSSILASDFLPDKSQTAINGKASREDLSRHRDPNIRYISSLYKARKTKPSVTEGFKEFLWGLTLSDGTFVKTKRKNRDTFKFSFRIEMVEEELLDNLYNELGIGHISTGVKRLEGHSNTKIWSVDSIGQISETLIPLFNSIDGDEWGKYEKYKKWRDNFLEYYNIPYCRSKLDGTNSSYSTWTTKEDSILEELYPYISLYKLTDLFDRSQSAIKKKASRENISKIDGFGRVKNISEYDDSEFYYDLLDNIQFIVGYISGDGSFSNTDGRYRVSISSSSQNSDQLQELADLMGGYPKLHVEDEARNDNWKRSAQLQISNNPFLLCTLIPLLDEAEWYSASKKEQFEEWKEGLHTKVDVDSLWVEVERHNRAKQKYKKLLNKNK